MRDVEDKQRIIQEYVPGKQVTLAHIVAGPTADLYRKLGLAEDSFDALGIMTITPSEASIIAADVATKASDVRLGFIDRFSGALVLVGDVSSVEAAVREALRVLTEVLDFSRTEVTRT